MTGFAGFPAETFAFLEGIASHNEKAWFEANRPLYDVGYVEAGKAFVAALGPRLRELSPAVQFDPRINGSVARINRDIRFSKDKRPYKDHLDLWFWHGDRKGWDTPGFWFRLTPQHAHLGIGMHMLDKPQLESFRQAVVHPRSGNALLEAVAQVRANGDYEIGEKTRKLAPRGYETEPERAEYLLYEGLTAGTRLPVESARTAEFADRCLAVWRDTWPIARWLLDEIAG